MKISVYENKNNTITYILFFLIVLNAFTSLKKTCVMNIGMKNNTIGMLSKNDYIPKVNRERGPMNNLLLGNTMPKCNNIKV